MRCHHCYHTQIVSPKTRKQLTTEIMKTTVKTEPVTIPTTSSLPLSRPCEPDEELLLDGNELFHWSSTHQHSIYLLSLPQQVVAALQSWYKGSNATFCQEPSGGWRNMSGTGCDQSFGFPSVLWHWLLGDRRDNRPVKITCTTYLQRFTSRPSRNRLTEVHLKNNH